MFQWACGYFCYKYLLIHIQDELEDVTTNYEQEQTQLKELEERFKVLEEEYTVIMEEKRIAREKAEKAANELQKMARAATVIQVINCNSGAFSLEFMKSLMSSYPFVINGPFTKLFSSR